MRFTINFDAFDQGEIKDGVIPLKIKQSGRMLFLNENARALFHGIGEWTELNDFAKDAPSDLRRDYQDALVALSCFGAAEIIEEAADNRACRVAWERDYEVISGFILKNAGKGLGYCLRTDAVYYDQANVRARQFNNMEYNFLKEKEGQLIADLVMAVPDIADVTSAATVQSLALDGALSEEESLSCLHDLLWFAQKSFNGEFYKFRFRYFEERQNWLRGALLKEGFEKTCVLTREIANQIDVTLYDKMMV